MIELASASIADLAAALRSGDVRAADLIGQAAQNRDESLGAYKLWMPEPAAEAAAIADTTFARGLDFGPLQGLPVSVKDLYGLIGAPTHAGAPRPLPVAWEREGPVVHAVRNSMACIVGKTHTVEFAFGGVGSNPHWGTPRNPWGRDAHRVPGGSSAGAGVSLWEGTAVVALGSDTAGSVRVPASFTGTVGLKTTYGRWSLDGLVPLSPSLDTAGVLTRTVADAAIAFSVIDPRPTVVPDPADLSRTRLGVLEELYEGCAPDVVDAVRAAIRELEARGASIVRFSLPGLAAAREVFAAGGLAAPEFAAFLRRELPGFRATLDPNVRGRLAAVESMTAFEYLDRRARLAQAAKEANAALAEMDGVLSPTTPLTAPRLDEVSDPEGYRDRNMAALRNTSPGNLLDLCGLSVPVGLDGDGLPVGLQVMAARDDDEQLLSVGLAVENVLGTARERLGAPPR